MSTRRTLAVETDSYPLAEPFHITGYVMDRTDVIRVTLAEDGAIGRAEASGVYYRAGEDVAGMLAAIERVRPAIEAGIDRHTLQTLLPAGGARNALDCAIWDLEAALNGRPAWAIADLPEFRSLRTTCTISIGTPEAMARQALEFAGKFAGASALKLKLAGDDLDSERVAAVRRARPDAWIAVDANQGFDVRTFDAVLPALIAARVALIEQPFRVGEEHLLDGLDSPIAIAMDETVQDSDDLIKVAGRAQVVNIKLDKCGGLTEGLRMADAAAAQDMQVMVGNTIGSSLAMAPAMVLGQRCAFVDLDGPLLLARDWTPSVVYAHGLIHCPVGLWGGMATDIGMQR